MNLHRIARILLDTGLSHQAAARAAAIDRGTVAKYRERLSSSRIDVERLERLSEKELREAIVISPDAVRRRHLEPDWKALAARLSEPGMYMTDLHREYSEGEGSPFSYGTFKRRIKAELRRRGPVMRIPRVPGEEGFVDFSGKPPSVLNPTTGKRERVELFVATLGHSRLTFVYAVKDQTVSSWLRAHVEMFKYWGGVPKYIVPDNLKAGVIIPRGNKAGFRPNQAYACLADHYYFLILPARPRRPQDKGGVEAGVKLAGRWIVQPLRDQVYTSLGELNAAIRPLLERLNDRPMKAMGGRSRRQIFEEEEKHLLRPLPIQPYSELEHVCSTKVPRDYYVEQGGNFYSVPSELIGEDVEVMVERDAVAIFHRHKRVAIHPRLSGRGQRSTIPSHMTEAHAAYANQRREHSYTWGSMQAYPIRAYLKAHRQLWKNPHATSLASKRLERLVELYGEEIVSRATLWITTQTPKQLQIRRVEAFVRQPELMRPPSHDEDGEADPIRHHNIRGADYYREAGK